MLKTLMKAALGASVVMLGATGANAAKVKSATLNLNSIGKVEAIAEDGYHYSKLQFNQLAFHGALGVKMQTGKALHHTIYSGLCGSGSCGSSTFPSLHSENVPGPLGKKKFKTNLAFWRGRR